MLKRLKLLPWTELSLIALLTNFIVLAIEILSTQVLQVSTAMQQVLEFLYSGPVGILIPVIATIGMGALAVYLFEWRRWQIFLNGGSLWALVFCLLVGLYLKSDLLIPLLRFPVAQFVIFSQMSLISLLIGVFWKGRPYYR